MFSKSLEYRSKRRLIAFDSFAWTRLNNSSSEGLAASIADTLAERAQFSPPTMGNDSPRPGGGVLTYLSILLKPKNNTEHRERKNLLVCEVKHY
jgi:hypothetical protein